MSQSRVRVIIIEDHLLLASSLETWLSRQPGCTVVGVAPDAEAGWKLCLSAKPDVALIDIGLPGVDGLELARRLRLQLPQLRVLAMSGSIDEGTIVRVWRSNVDGYIEKLQSPQLLWDAVRAVFAGGTFFGPIFHEVRDASRAQFNETQKTLSPREREVLALLAQGADDAQIAAQLGMTPRTSAVHRQHIRQKLGITNDSELRAYARHALADRTIAQLPAEAPEESETALAPTPSAETRASASSPSAS